MADKPATERGEQKDYEQTAKAVKDHKDRLAPHVAHSKGVRARRYSAQRATIRGWIRFELSWDLKTLEPTSVPRSSEEIYQMISPIADTPLHGLSRRGFIVSLTTLTASLAGGSAQVSAATGTAAPFAFSAITDQVIPAAGFRTGVSFGDSLQRLIAAGVIDPDKYRSLYNAKRAIPDWVERLLAKPSTEPITFSRASMPYLVNLLWPLGLATKSKFNDKSPLNTLRIPNFASTGGWTIGKLPRGYVYFNSVDAVPMTDRQDALVLQVAHKTFRPCCDNSTLFQDCNHGSALLGLIELAASQEFTEANIYRIAMAANSHWFPDQYVRTAVYFAQLRHRSWHDLDPQLVLGSGFSSLSGWRRNVDTPLNQASITVPGILVEPPRC